MGRKSIGIVHWSFLGLFSATSLVGCAAGFEAAKHGKAATNASNSAQTTPTWSTIITPTATPTPAATPTPTPAVAPTLQGTWKQDCVAETDKSARASYTFNGANYKLTTQVYGQDTSCSTLNVIATLEGTFMLPGQVTNPAGAWKFDSVLVRATLTPQGFTTAFGMNYYEVCGITDWSDGVMRDVTGKNCDGVALVGGATLYNVLKSVSATMFQLGEPGNPGSATDATSADRRPTVLMTQPFIKQ